MSKDSFDLNFYKTFLTEDLYLIPEKEVESASDDIEKPSESIEELQEEAAPEPPKEFLVVHESNGKISNEEYDLLKNILNAVNISLKDDVELVELDTSKSIDYTLEYHNPTLLIFSEKSLFGDQTYYEEFLLNEKQVLLSKKLTTLLSDRSEKANLWKALKKMFEV
ncbi:MAG: hypothetical protein AAF363_15915 [Bacteroidota bacterium]